MHIHIDGSVLFTLAAILYYVLMLWHFWLVETNIKFKLWVFHHYQMQVPEVKFGSEFFFKVLLIGLTGWFMYPLWRLQNAYRRYRPQ